MSDLHLTDELIAAWRSGTISNREMALLCIEHLACQCPQCKTGLEHWRQRSRRLDFVFAAALEALAQTLRNHLKITVQRTERDLRKLRRLDTTARKETVRRARTRFASRDLARRLIEESTSYLPDNPLAAEAWAELATLVSWRAGEVGNSSPVCWVRANAHLANARRTLGKLRESSRLFRHIRGVIQRHQLQNPLLLAEIDDLEGSLHRDQRHFDHALDLFERSTTLYRVAGEKIFAGRVLINIAATHQEDDNPTLGAKIATQAAELFDEESQPRLRLCAVHTLANCLCTTGDFEEARRVLGEHADLYEHYPDDWTQLRRKWVEGRVAAGLGEVETAERFFRAAREGFVAGNQAYDVALVSLDLAQLHLEQGRTREVFRLAKEMVTIFRAHDIHREAMAAVLLFLEAAKKEEVTTTLVKHLARYLAAARSNPALAFPLA